MKILTPLFIFFQLCFAVAVEAQTKATKNKAIICLTYDDGLETQMTTVLPLLDSLGLKATFFLPAIQGASQSETIGATPEGVVTWTRAAKSGHELGNHTLFHPCPEKLGWDQTVSLEQYNVDRIVKEVAIQGELLAQLDPARTTRSYAFPCNITEVDGVDYGKILYDKKLVSYARVGGDQDSYITNFKNLDPLKVPSWHVWTATTSAELIAFAEKVKNKGGMGVYQFHGVGGNIFSVSAEAHRAFLIYLKNHQQDFLILSFSQAMDEAVKRGK